MMTSESMKSKRPVLRFAAALFLLYYDIVIMSVFVTCAFQKLCCFQIITAVTVSEFQ